MTLSWSLATAARSLAAFSRPRACALSARMSRAGFTPVRCRAGSINVAASVPRARTNGTLLCGVGVRGPVKVHVEAYGCTQNQGEARLMQALLLREGHDVLAGESDADAHLLVTCTVVERTERDMVARMRALAATGKPLVVAGCMAAAQRTLVSSIVPRARVVPPRRWREVATLFESDTACSERAQEIETARLGYHDAIVPIAQGCVGRCTYCITRVARGRVSSRPLEELVGEVQAHVDRGIREIKLTGQDTAAWGVDRGANLAGLLTEITAIPGEFRVRVGMADPLAVFPIVGDLVAAFDSEKVFKFLHLPVQSGDDGILAAMQRDHSVADFEDIVRRFRASFPDLTLSTDVIVGFAGETD
ncbi:MAG: tRNA (N(6)-L-threonylcarbamoyladenosine(37)-C(2))-methylthiotransferase, partial [Methanobacteriota archaeon]